MAYLRLAGSTAQHGTRSAASPGSSPGRASILSRAGSTAQQAACIRPSLGSSPGLGSILLCLTRRSPAHASTLGHASAATHGSALTAHAHAAAPRTWSSGRSLASWSRKVSGRVSPAGATPRSSTATCCANGAGRVGQWRHTGAAATSVGAGAPSAGPRTRPSRSGIARSASSIGLNSFAAVAKSARHLVGIEEIGGSTPPRSSILSERGIKVVRQFWELVHACSSHAAQTTFYGQA